MDDTEWTGRVPIVSTFALIHGAGDVGWYWHLVEAELLAHGHGVVAPDLPAGDDSAGLDEYADTVIDAVGDRKDLVVVGQSFGAFTAPLVADRLPTDVLVLVAGMIPSPVSRPGTGGRTPAMQARYRNRLRVTVARPATKTRTWPSTTTCRASWPPKR